MYKPTDEHHLTLKTFLKSGPSQDLFFLFFWILLISTTLLQHSVGKASLGQHLCSGQLTSLMELFSTSRSVSWLHIWYKGWLLHSLITHCLCKYTDIHRAPQCCDIVKAVLYMNPQNRAGQTQQHWKQRKESLNSKAQIRKRQSVLMYKHCHVLT